MRRAIPVVLLVLLLMVSCSGPGPSPEPMQSPLFSSIVPTPVSSQIILGPAFRLDPVKEGAREVTGQGPVGFTLVVVDSSFGGWVLGSGKPDQNGNFTIQLNKPLEKGHLIGLTVDVAPEVLSAPDFGEKMYEIRGPGYRLVPNSVNVYDSREVP